MPAVVYLSYRRKRGERMKLYFKKLNENAVLPVRGSVQSAGADLSACITEPVTIAPHEIRLIPTGLSAALELEAGDQSAMLMLCARSGLAAKHGIGLANGVGIIDLDYRGEIKAALVNQSETPFTVEPGMRIAQIIAVPVWLPEICEADALQETERGAGGFGSTGLK